MKYIDKLNNLRSRREMSPTQISDDVMIGAINHVRLGCTAKNGQTLRYGLINDEIQVLDIFKCTNLPTKHGVSENQKPSAFIVIGKNDEILQNNLVGMDIGIAVQIIREYFHELDNATVCIYSFNREIVKDVIGVDSFYPECLIAVGKSDQVVHLEDSSENVENYRDDNNEHVVRKLTSEKIIVNK